ncbi:MAG: C39 family peptidase [Bacteroidota bacterium]
MQLAKRLTWMIPLMLLVTVGFYNLPAVHDRLGWRLDNLRTQIKYFFNPPDQAVFQPDQQINFDMILATTRAEFALTLTPRPVQATGTPRPGPTSKPTLTATPLPASVDLKGFRYEDQHNRWNYCGPANFSMALNFWGWDGNRDVIGKAVKPSDRDKNVMPYEFQDFIREEVPGMSSVMRYGGDIDVVKRLLAAGYPVVAEKGYYERDYAGKVGWMGHYQFITGYDDAARELIVQDTYNDGPNFHISYEKFMEGWRSFDFVFVVVYPSDRESEILALLGPLADERAAARHALDVANRESQSLTGIDRFFAWFNQGTSHVALQEYVDAAMAYDYAFQLYAQLQDNDTTRPYRIMWYQTGPYFAYYYSARYADVINLANTTLKDTIASPDLEESLLWRGRAYYMAGKTPQAISDYRLALKVHPDWAPAIQALRDLGATP